MNRLFFGLLLSCVFCSSNGQVVQKGMVLEYNESHKKTPLSNVELNIVNAGSTASNKDGSFTLTFRTLKAGDKVMIRRIEKLGYEVFNKDALTQWNISREGNPFIIIMCRSDRFKRIRDNYFKISSESYARQMAKEQDRLALLKKEGKIKEQEYRKNLEQIQEEYNQRLENLDNYIDKFARIDLSELSKTEKNIVEMVQGGKIDEAIKVYEDMQLEEKYLEIVKEKKKLSDAIDSLNFIKQERVHLRDTLNAVILEM